MRVDIGLEWSSGNASGCPFAVFRLQVIFILRLEKPQKEFPMSNFTVPAIKLIDSRPCVTSLAIAEHFGKRHDAVLRDIRALIANCPEEFGRHNFVESSYTNEQNKQQPMYHVFFDGFILL